MNATRRDRHRSSDRAMYRSMYRARLKNIISLRTHTEQENNAAAYDNPGVTQSTPLTTPRF